MKTALWSGFLYASLIANSIFASPISFDFEGDAIGSQPTGWVGPFGSSVGGGGIISDAQASSGDQSLLIRGTGSTARSLGRPGSFSADNDRFSIDLYAPGTNGTTGNIFFIGIYGGLRFDLYQNGSADTVDLFLNPTSGLRITGINRDEWFNVLFAFDWDNGLVDAFLNGSQVADDLAFSPNFNGGPSSDLTFQGLHQQGSGGVAGHTFVDNIQIFESTSSVSEPGALMLLVLGLLSLAKSSQLNYRRNIQKGNWEN